MFYLRGGKGILDRKLGRGSKSYLNTFTEVLNPRKSIRVGQLRYRSRLQIWDYKRPSSAVLVLGIMKAGNMRRWNIDSKELLIFFRVFFLVFTIHTAFSHSMESEGPISFNYLEHHMYMEEFQNATRVSQRDISS